MGLCHVGRLADRPTGPTLASSDCPDLTVDRVRISDLSFGAAESRHHADQPLPDLPHQPTGGGRPVAAACAERTSAMSLYAAAVRCTGSSSRHIERPALLRTSARLSDWQGWAPHSFPFRTFRSFLF